MARLPEANETYAVAESFRGRCLAGGRSLLWPDAPAWTTENLDRLWTAFVQHPDESKDKSFLEKWQGQLSEEPDDVCRIAADVLVLYHLINSGTKPETKSAEIHRLISWRFPESPPELLEPIPNPCVLQKCFTHPDDEGVTSGMDPGGENRLKRFLLNLEARIRAWEAFYDR